MDLMFEDEADDVGSDVEAYCPKCKTDTTHVVISKYEDEIRRVQCNPCGDVHSYRKPRGEVEDDVPEPVAARKRALMKKPTWDEFFAKHNAKKVKPYEFREPYNENAMVEHPKFGVGYVSEVVSNSKVEITFKDARRILVHNRRDIPGVPLAAEGDGQPTPPPAKAAGKVATKTAGKPAGKPANHVKLEVAQPKGEAKVDTKADRADKPESKADAKAVPGATAAKGKAPTPAPVAKDAAKVATKAPAAPVKGAAKDAGKAKPAAPAPAPKEAAKAKAPAPREVAKPAPRAAAKPAPKAVAAKPAPKAAAAKPVKKPAAKPVPKAATAKKRK
jgi:Zn ribbon nucleic-acid-binding protein